MYTSNWLEHWVNIVQWSKERLETEVESILKVLNSILSKFYLIDKALWMKGSYWKFLSREWYDSTYASGKWHPQKYTQYFERVKAWGRKVNLGIIATVPAVWTKTTVLGM